MPVGAQTNPIGYNELLSTTVQKLESTLVDQVLQAHPTLDVFKGVMSPGDGPNHIQPVRGALVNRTQYTDQLGTFNQAQDGEIAGVAVYEYSDPIVTPTSIAFRAATLNQGSNKLIDMVKAHIEAARDDHAAALAGALYGNAITTPGGSATFNDLDAIVDDTAALGGIDPATATWWKSSVRTSSAAAENIKVPLRKLSNQVLDASAKKVNVIIAGADVFDEYEESLDDAVRYNALGVGDTRFSELKFDGLTIRRDGIDCPADKAYFLNTGSLVAKNLAGYFMKVMPSQTINGTLTDVTPFATMLLFGTSARREHGVMTRTA
jgi:hypothetical protein